MAGSSHVRSSTCVLVYNRLSGQSSFLGKINYFHLRLEATISPFIMVTYAGTIKGHRGAAITSIYSLLVVLLMLLALGRRRDTWHFQNMSIRTSIIGPIDLQPASSNLRGFKLLQASF